MSAKSFYEQYYTDLDAENRRWRERSGAAKAQNIIAIAGDMPARTVIEIGGGTGAVLANLARSSFGAQFWALDIAEEAIELIRGRDDLPGLVEARVFDGEHIPYQDKQFDLAILSHVIEHVADPRSLLLEAVRVADYVAVEVPLEDNLYTFLKVRAFKSDYRERIGHVQWFSQRSFKHLLESVCNLNVVRMRVVCVPDELYFMRKKGVSRVLISVLLYLRKMIRLFSGGLYTRLLTDHCIALVCSRR